MSGEPKPSGTSSGASARRTGRLIVISGLSGAGKTTIAERLLQDPRFARALTATTREPRRGEQDGVDYRFLTESAFRQGIERGDFLEHAVVYGRLYGTPRENVRKILDSGRHCLLVVDVQGAASLRALGIEATFVFVKAPSLEQLEARLRRRARDDDEEIQARLEAVRRELAEEAHFDVVLVNETVEAAARELARHLGIDLRGA